MAGFLGRYRTWNPVHPTHGAFWGVGVGLGCGVGWGPGFGHEAVGFVGSGCGLGLSVGITLIGFGIGLPASGALRLPFDSVVWTAKGASEVTSKHVVPALVLGFHQAWQGLSVQSAAVGTSLRGFSETEMRRGREFLGQLQQMVVKDCHGSPQVIASPRVEAPESKGSTQNVHFRRRLKWDELSSSEERPS